MVFRGVLGSPEFASKSLKNCMIPALKAMIYCVLILLPDNLAIIDPMYSTGTEAHTVYSKKYAHGFVVLCFVVVMQSFIMNSHEIFIHIHQGCFAGTGAIVRLSQCQWSKPDGYGKISQCITTIKHSKANTVCIFLGIYCTSIPCKWRNHSYGYLNHVNPLKIIIIYDTDQNNATYFTWASNSMEMFCQLPISFYHIPSTYCTLHDRIWITMKNA